MTTIIRKQSEIAATATDILVATYNALTGKSIKKFSSRAAGERQVEMAMLAAQDNDAHTGVPKDTVPKVITIEEAAVKAEAMGGRVEPAPEPASETCGEHARIVFEPGSLADQLDRATIRTAPIVPRAKKAPSAPAAARQTLTHVRATGTGKSKVQAASTRGAVLAFINSASPAAVAVAALDAKFNCNTKGFLQKLIEMDHITPCDAAGIATAAPEAK